MICSSVNLFFTSTLLSVDWTPSLDATQNRGDVGFKKISIAVFLDSAIPVPGSMRGFRGEGVDTVVINSLYCDEPLRFI